MVRLKQVVHWHRYLHDSARTRLNEPRQVIDGETERATDERGRTAPAICHQFVNDQGEADKPEERGRQRIQRDLVRTMRSTHRVAQTEQSGRDKEEYDQLADEKVGDNARQ